MKFSTREDIEAPIEQVFAAISDFDTFERQALRRGADVQRQDSFGRPGLGSEWHARFPFRGKEREVDARVVEFDAPNGLAVESDAHGISGMLTVDLMALSPRRTRLQIGLDLRPQNLSARLLIQSLKFAKTNLSKRFSNRIWQFARSIEGRYREAV